MVIEGVGVQSGQLPLGQVLSSNKYNEDESESCVVLIVCNGKKPDRLMAQALRIFLLRWAEVSSSHCS